MAVNGYVVCYVTVPTRQEAESISRMLLDKKLVACVNRVGPVQSLYWWQGHVDKADEYLLIMKSIEEKKEEIVEAVRLVHSYEVPEILFLPIIAGHEAYLSWIGDSLK